MPIVTLTTDFGDNDYHLPRLKASLLKHCRGVQITDISHNTPVFDIVQAAFIFSRVWNHFPDQTIHVLSVNDFYQPRGRFVVTHYKNHFFVAPDNGILSLIFTNMPPDSWVVDMTDSHIHLSDVYAKIVSHIADGKPLANIGRRSESLTEKMLMQPIVNPDTIKGLVVFIDRFGNAVTNITKQHFEQVGQNRGFQIMIRRMQPIDGLSFRFHDVPEGETLCRFNSDNFLEVAINMGDASTLLGVRLEDVVLIEFGE